MYICICLAVCDREIRSCVERGARTVDEVGDATGAGTGCGSCHDRIEVLLTAGQASDEVAGLPATA